MHPPLLTPTTEAKSRRRVFPRIPERRKKEKPVNNHHFQRNWMKESTRHMNDNGDRKNGRISINTSNMHEQMSQVKDNAPHATVHLQEIELPPKCVFCHSEDHDANQCKQVADWKDRRRYILNNGICYMCLGQVHKAPEVCPKKYLRCQLCAFKFYWKPEKALPRIHYSLCNIEHVRRHRLKQRGRCGRHWHPVQ